MAITEAARKNHEDLFLNHESQLAVSDPELIEVFDNFAFDEVIAQGKLDARTRVMLILAAIIGSQAVNEYKIMVARRSTSASCQSRSGKSCTSRSLTSAW